MCKNQWIEASREEADQCMVPEQTRGAGTQAQLPSQAERVPLPSEWEGKGKGRHEAGRKLKEFSPDYFRVPSGNPPQYSRLGNPMDRGPRWATVRRVTKSLT